MFAMGLFDCWLTDICVWLTFYSMFMHKGQETIFCAAYIGLCLWGSDISMIFIECAPQMRLQRNRKFPRLPKTERKYMFVPECKYRGPIFDLSTPRQAHTKSFTHKPKNIYIRRTHAFAPTQNVMRTNHHRNRWVDLILRHCDCLHFTDRRPSDRIGERSVRTIALNSNCDSHIRRWGRVR